MRTIRKTMLILGLFVCSAASLFSQKILFTDIKVIPRWVPGPGVQASNIIGRGVKLQTRWLQINVDYTSTVMKQGWLDDVVIKYDVLLPQTTSRKVVLSGQVQYWSLAMDGETNHAQAFVNPRFLQRYAPGLQMRKSDLKDLRILVTFLQNDSPIAMGVYKPSSKTSPISIKNEISKALQDRRTFKSKDSVFGRDQTPWGVLNVDYYELIKRKK